GCAVCCGAMASSTLQLRALLYAVLPSESRFRSLHEVPNYVEKSIPFFIGFIALEFAVSWVQRRKLAGRINDGISSLSLGILSRLPECSSDLVLRYFSSLGANK
uniref:Alkylglycerol monooxygenase n=1 Tax=Nothoprocta perdicaria TaxID=30464 RepID=A0A8C6YT78_NOTPE